MQPKTKQMEQVLRRLREILDRLPEATEKEAWGHPTFRAGKKMFAAMGQGHEGEIAIGLRVGFERQQELLKDARFFPTPYAAHQGWVSLRVDAKPNWREVEALMREAYGTVALKRMLTRLGEQ